MGSNKVGGGRICREPAPKRCVCCLCTALGSNDLKTLRQSSMLSKHVGKVAVGYVVGFALSATF